MVKIQAKTQERRKINRRKIYKLLINNISVKEVLHSGQGQVQEWQEACDTQEEDSVNSQLPQLLIRFKHRRRSRRATMRWQQKQRRQGLNQDMWWENHYMQQTGQEVSTYKRNVREQYGFVADPTKPLWDNCTDRINELKSAHSLIGNSIQNWTCHKLTDCQLPGIDAFLGLGLILHQPFKYNQNN